MEKELLIKTLRYCAEHEGCDYYIAKDCPREDTWVCGADCEQILMHDAADALEAAEKRIAQLEEDLKTREAEREVMQDTIKICEEAADRYKAQLPKEGEWMRTDAFPHRIYCSVCYKTYVPNDRWEIWVDEYLPRRFCPNCGARMKGERDGKQ